MENNMFENRFSNNVNQSQGLSHADSNVQTFVSLSNDDSQKVLDGYAVNSIGGDEFGRICKLYESSKREMQYGCSAKRLLNLAVIFESISFYQDSSLLAQQCRFEAKRKVKKKKINIAIICSSATAVVVAFAIVLTMSIIPYAKNESFKDELRNAAVGDTVIFGEYEQDNNIINGKEDISWIVVSKEDDKVVLVSAKGLDCLPYNESGYVPWEECSLRSWLNEEFIEEAFSEGQQKLLYHIMLNDYNANTKKVETSVDRVFLLNNYEVVNYKLSESNRVCYPTEYAVARGAYIKDSDARGRWWLRSICFETDEIKLMGHGYIDEDLIYHICGKESEKETDCCVRPAIMIDVSD